MLDLLDYRRRMAELFQAVRHSADPAGAAGHFRAAKDALFKTHPQSPLNAAQKDAFAGLVYAPYDPAYRVVGTLDTAIETATFTVDLGEDGRFSYRRFGRVQFALPGGAGALNVYWIEGYGGGVFLPFKDASSGRDSYGGGRYLLDTLKGADLGADYAAGTLLLDFNYAYHPSCYYNPRWVCPLAPPENTLPFAVLAGERLPAGECLPAT